ncbi:peroxidase family protein [Jannaschia seohaensis]|uniref:Peroxidase n=1 Tax=Jannaschia seohaensis TaxID=475081 RepID=A0A2Y9AJG8_9RHOB|nr:peroxidase family protein [Jannaschia seohaensis]PWJ20392.1 peroxidase [Jannaschia seohaensis]SSA44460.1 peroxidase [Jannaschia seohaensis]
MSDHPEVDPGTPAARCPFLANLEQMPRLTEARYQDALGELYQGADPMKVASKLFDQEGDMPNSNGISALFTTWGQFLDHDMSLTPEGDHETMENDAFSHGVGRSDYMKGSGEEGPREYGNSITWQIDGSMIYGSNAGRVEDVRSHEGGRLRMDEEGLLPKATPETVMAGETDGEDAVFLAGDIRANENPNLLTLHTLWVREHNHWADRLAEEHPDWDDDALFEGARQIVEFELQKITYEEWLPLLIGNAVPQDTAHDPDVDGQVALEFSTAAFRFGHTLVASRMDRLEEDGSEAEGGHQALMDGFFDTEMVREHGIDAFLRGMAGQSAQELDTKVVDDLNFFLQTPEGVSGFSLPALNLMRSADHGMDSYVSVRAELLGDIDPEALDPQDFSIITADPAIQAELASVYDTVHQVDLWVGGLAEDAEDGMLGPLFTHIVSDQFARTAQGDASFGQLDPALGEAILAEVEASGLRDVILRNSEVDHLQENPFLMQVRELEALLCVEATEDADQIALAAKAVAGPVLTGGGDDSLTVTGGTRFGDSVDLGDGDDSLAMTSGNAGYGVDLGAGDDTAEIGGSARVSVLTGGAGNDTVSVGGSAQVWTLETGAGADRVEVSGKAEVEIVRLGEDDDTAVLGGAGVSHLDGGAGFDRLDVRAAESVRFDCHGDGSVAWGDGSTTTFKNFEMVTCFTEGTRLATARGQVPIEMLRPGARVWTLDHGLRTVRWVGRTEVRAEGRLAPIRFAPGALGNARALEVSPQHRMLVESSLSELFFGAAQVLAPAHAFLGRPGVTRRTGGTVTYIHLLFDRHEIVLAEGIPSESFHPGPVALSAMDRATRAELLALFPSLARPDAYGPSARPSLKPAELRLLG